MFTVQHRSKSFRAAVAAPVLLLALAGCGSSDNAATPSDSATGAPGAGGGQGGGGFGGADFTAIQACLKAAGISLPTPSGGFGGRPSGSARPSDAANGTPRARPSGAAGGGGGGAGMFQSAEVQAALKACGIAVPTGRGERPTATPTS